MANPTISIDPVAGDDTITPGKALAGIDISGTTINVEDGQIVTINILNASDNSVVDTLTATVSNNAWEAELTQGQADALDGAYTVTADVFDHAGDPAPEATRAVAATNATANLYFTGFVSNDWTQNELDQNSNAILFTNWTGNATPTSSDNVEIGPGNPDATVVVGASTYEHTSLALDVNALILDDGNILNINTGPLTVESLLEADGSINVNGSELVVGGHIIAGGQINVYTTLALKPGTTNLAGAGLGALTLVGGAFLTGVDPNQTATLENDGTIQGNGNITAHQLSIDSPGAPLIVHNNAAGVIDANDSAGQLLIYTYSTVEGAVTNAGLIEDTNTAGMQILNTLVMQSATGKIGAYGAGSIVDLNNSSIVGGTIDGSGGGQVGTALLAGVGTGNITLDGSTPGDPITITASASFAIADGGVVTIVGDVINHGTIALHAVGHTAELHVGTGDVTFSGGGRITMVHDAGDYDANDITGVSTSAPTLLRNVDNTIEGSGILGNISNLLLNIDNQSDGKVDATGTATDGSEDLTLSAANVTNAGVLESTAGALNQYGQLVDGLLIGAYNGTHATVVQTNIGVIGATGADAHVDLQNATVEGGTLTTADGGIIRIDGNGATLDGLSAGAITNLGFVQVNDGITAIAFGAIANSGTVSLAANGHTTELEVTSGGLTLTGGGSLLIEPVSGGYNANVIAGDGNISAPTLHNVNNTIRGAGLIGNDPNHFTLAIDNQSGGVIDADVAGSPGAYYTLTIQTSAGVTNGGLIEDTANSGLELGAYAVGYATTISQTNTGVIEANGSGAHVDLVAAHIIGGTLATSNGGVIDTQGFYLDNTGNSLDGTTSGGITNRGSVQILDGSNLTISGAINNSGTITVHAIGHSTDLQVGSGGATLSGGGAVLMQNLDGDYNANELSGDNTISAFTLTNVDNTIMGAGTIGSNGYHDLLLLDNQSGGTIEANNSSASLTINTGINTVTAANAGKLEATNSATLLIQSTTMNNSGGVIVADDHSQVQLQNSDIEGGTLTTSGTGVFTVLDDETLINGAENGAVTNSATIVIGAGHMLAMDGTIHNDAMIEIGDSGGNHGIIYAAGTFDGGGKIALIDNGANRISGSVDNVDNTIMGAGIISGALTNDTNGIVAATFSDTRLTISGNTVNNGRLEASGGTLEVDVAITGAGSALVTAGGTAIFNAAFDQNVVFQGNAALEIASAYTGTISGFAIGDTIDLTSVSFDPSGSATMNGDTLDVVENGNEYQLQFSAPITGTFVLSGDGHNGTDITISGVPVVPVSSGVTSTVTSGQTVVNFDIQSGGSVLVDGGTTQNATVENGGALDVQNGGITDPTIVSSGGSQVVGSGGTDLGALLSGGLQIISAGGTAEGVSILSGGTQLDYGSATGANIGNGGLQFIVSGGTASGTTALGGGEEYIGAGGSSLAAQIQGGGAEVVFGTDSGASLSGTQYDFGIALGGTTLSNGFQQVALAGAVASGMTIEFGGEQYVGMGGTTLAAQVGGGGAEVVFGIDSGASLSGTQYDFGTATGGTTYNNGYQLVAPGAVASGMTVMSGGVQYIGSGGTAVATDIAAQGAQEVFGSALETLVSGTQYDFAYASGGTTFNDGYQLVAPGATAFGMTVESGGQQYIGANGTASATDIAAQGVEVIFGTDSGALVSGTQYVFGVASGGTTYNGGYQLVGPAGAGSAIGMTVLAGGQQYVVGGATASGTELMSQGVEIVHGTDLEATISGTEYVYGLASGSVVDTGGYQLVSAGGTISAASISGGTIELMGGASTGAAPISFTGAGQLILDASRSFSGTVAGFGTASLSDTIDFADISYVASGSAGATTVGWSQLTSGANASGTLTVSQGGHSADITLLGQYAVGNFTPSNDGHGGTLVTDPPIAAATDLNPMVLAVARHA